MVDLSVTVFGSTFQNPVLLASGTCGYGQEYSGVIDVDALGAWPTSVSMASRRLILNSSIGLRWNSWRTDGA